MLAGGIGAAVLLQPARAQLLDSYFPNGLPVDTALTGPAVLDRPRPDYDPPGVRAGNLVIRPLVTESLGDDSNVLGVSGGPGSGYLQTQAGITASSSWDVSSARAAVAVRNVAYMSLPDQSYTNWTASLGGSHEIGRDTVSLDYFHGSLNVLPTSIGSFGIAAPRPYAVDVLTGSYALRLGRLTFTPALSLQAYRFANTLQAGQILDAGVNNRNTLVGTLTVAYELSPSRDVIFIVRGVGNNYTAIPAGTPSSNSSGLAVLGGLQYTADALVRYRVLVGYEQRSYTSPAYVGQQTPVAEVSAIWTPTGLTTATVTLARTMEEALSAGTLGYTYSVGRIVVDHEYLPNVLLQGLAGVELQQQTVGQGATQTLYGLGLGVTWLMNRNMKLTGSYSFTKDNGAPSYTRNVVSLSLGLQL